MPKLDFKTILEALTISEMGGRYSPVYLSMGFLSAALRDDDTVDDIIERIDPERLQDLRNLSSKIQVIIDSAAAKGY